MKHKYLLLIACIIAIVHLGSVLLLASRINAAPGSEAIEYWMIFGWIDFPISLLSTPLEGSLPSELFYPIYFGILGTLQWILIVYGIGWLVGRYRHA